MSRTTIHTLIERARAEHGRYDRLDASLTADLEAMKTALDRGDTSITSAAVQTKVNERAVARAGLDQARAKVEDLEAEQKRDAEVDAMSKRITPTGAAPAYDQVARVGVGSPGHGHGSPTRDDGPRWVRTDDGRPATVARDQRFADHDVVAGHIERTVAATRPLSASTAASGTWSAP